MRHKDVVGASIAALAEAQEGSIAHWQLCELGLSRSAIARRVRSGWLCRRHHGVYAVGHRRSDARHRWFAAILACGPGAALSHRPGAALYDLPGGSTGIVHVSVPVAGGRKAPEGVVVHRVADLARERTTHAGLPVTTVERTLLDIALVVSPRMLVRAIEAAEAQRVLDYTKLIELCASGRAGARPLRAAVALPPTVTRSVLEDRFLALCDRHGVSAPLVNHRVGPFEVDFFWPRAGLVVETDGHRHHGTREAFEEDRRRDATLMVMGLRVVRFTHRQVMNRGAETARTVIALLSTT